MKRLFNKSKEWIDNLKQKLNEIFKQGIRRKLIALMLIISLTPILVLSYLEVKSTRQTVKNNFVESSRREIKQVDNAIAVYLESVRANLEMIAEYPVLKQADDTITTYLHTEEKINPTPLSNGDTEAAIYRKLFNFVNSHPKVGYAHFTATDGSYVHCPANQIKAGYDPRKKPFYKLAMENKGEIIRTQAYSTIRNIGGNYSTITLAKTVKNKQGEILGVLGLDVNLEILTNMMQSISVGTPGYVILTNEQGTILGHPQQPVKMAFKDISKLGVEKLEQIEKIRSDDFAAIMGEKEYLMNVYTSPETSWKFIAVIEKKELSDKLTPIYKRIFWVALISSLLVIIISVFFSGRFSRPIVAATGFAQRIAKQDLTGEPLEVEANDEVADLIESLNKMYSNLKQIVGEIVESTDNLSAYSQQLTAAAQEGEATLEETNSNLAEMSSSIQQVSAVSKEVDELAQETKSHTELGNENMEQTETNIEQITSSVDQAVEVMEELDQTTDEINQIVEMISQITDETDLLALNAAIEAARAGSDANHNSRRGKGFAVVAEEIRELAEETSQAADKIKTLVEKTQEQSKVSLKAVTEVAEEAHAGKEVVEETGRVFNQIMDKIEVTSQQIEQTSTAAHRLAENSEQITEATHEISDMSSEITHSAEELAEMAQDLKEIVAGFKIES